MKRVCVPRMLVRMKVTSIDEQVSWRAPEEHFTGTVWADDVVDPVAPARMRVLRVSFEPGARTAWHSHPLGQALHVVSGLGRVQLQGQPVREIRPGDTVWIEPGEVHWHGSAPGRTMVHLAMHLTDEAGVEVFWADKVTDEEYEAPVSAGH